MNFAYRLLCSIAWLIIALPFPYKSIGRENIVKGGGLICANHTSNADPFLVAFAFGGKNQFRAMAKASLFRIPVLGWLLKAAGMFPVNRGKSDVTAIKTAMKLMKSGEKVLMFPEGTRVKEGESAEVKTGAAMLALRCEVPIIPVYVHPPRLFRRSPVIIGEPYYPTVGEGRPTAEDYQVIAEDIMARIRALKERVS